MDAHRKRLQDEHDRKAAEHAVKQAEVNSPLNLISYNLYRLTDRKLFTCYM